MSHAHLVCQVLIMHLIVVSSERLLIGQMLLGLPQPGQAVGHPAKQLLLVCERLLESRLPGEGGRVSGRGEGEKGRKKGERSNSTCTCTCTYMCANDFH